MQTFYLEDRWESSGKNILVSYQVNENLADMPKEGRALSLYLRRKIQFYLQSLAERLSASDYAYLLCPQFLSHAGIGKIHIYQINDQRKFDSDWIRRHNFRGALLVVDNVSDRCFKTLRQEVGSASLLAFTTTGIKFYQK